MRTQAILVTKITFIGLTNTEYTHIVVNNNSVVINNINRAKFKEVCSDFNLHEAKSNEYLGTYTPSLGHIFVDDNFQSTLNNNKSLKEFILDSIDEDY